jgi:hypothetical protein
MLISIPERNWIMITTPNGDFQFYHDDDKTVIDMDGHFTIEVTGKHRNREAIRAKVEKGTYPTKIIVEDE